MKHISLVIPYYDNPGMLAIHYAHWASLPKELKSKIDIAIVDDGLPGEAASMVPRPPDLPELAIYRVQIDKPWHQHAARNIGAHHAVGPWLLMTDMDHVIPITTWLALFERRNRHKVYMFSRVDAPDLLIKQHPDTGRPHPHPNSFAMTKELYWKVGGYDEDYCGLYGTDGMFRKRLFKEARIVEMNVPLICYPRDVQADSSTQTLARKEGRIPGAKKTIHKMKMIAGTFDIPKVLSMPYEKVYP